MTPFTFCSVELRRKTGLGRRHWFLHMRVFLPDDPFFAALIAGVRSDRFSDLSCHEPRGLPDGFDIKSIAEETLAVDNKAASLEIEGCTTKANATEWIQSGLSVWVHEGYRITHPDLHSHTWFSPSEFATVLDEYRLLGGENSEHLAPILGALSAAESSGFEARVLFYFE